MATFIQIGYHYGMTAANMTPNAQVQRWPCRRAGGRDVRWNLLLVVAGVIADKDRNHVLHIGIGSE